MPTITINRPVLPLSTFVHPNRSEGREQMIRFHRGSLNAAASSKITDTGAVTVSQSFCLYSKSSCFGDQIVVHWKNLKSSTFASPVIHNSFAIAMSGEKNSLKSLLPGTPFHLRFSGNPRMAMKWHYYRLHSYNDQFLLSTKTLLYYLSSGAPWWMKNPLNWCK